MNIQQGMSNVELFSFIIHHYLFSTGHLAVDIGYLSDDSQDSFL